jgi:HlyD family secretion protein
LADEPAQPDKQPNNDNKPSGSLLLRWLRTSGGRITVAVLVLAIAGGIGLYELLKPDYSEDFVVASGRIEGRITDILPKVSAWVAELPKDEGDPIRQGELLVRLDDPELRARRDASAAAVESTSSRLLAQRQDLDVTTREVAANIQVAEADLVSARAALERARANAIKARRDATRYTELSRQHYVSETLAETQRLNAMVADRAVVEASAAADRAQRQLTLAHLGEDRLEVLRAQVTALERDLTQAQKNLAQQEEIIQSLTITSPLDGVVLTRPVELGERVNPQSVLFTLVSLQRLYLKSYVPEPLIGKVALGQQAQVWVDAYPDKPFAAHVNRVSQQAEFTPKNVETREERVKQVFGVELWFDDNPGGVLKPGMPGDGVIRIKEGAPWFRPW